MIDFLYYVDKPDTVLQVVTRKLWQREAQEFPHGARLELLQRLDVQMSLQQNRITELRRRLDYGQFEYIADVPRLKRTRPKTLAQGIEWLEDNPQRDRLTVYAQELSVWRVMNRAWNLLGNNNALLKLLVDYYDERMLSAEYIQASIRALYPALDRRSRVDEQNIYAAPSSYAPIAGYIQRDWLGRAANRLIICDPHFNENHYDFERRRLYLYFQPVLEPYLAAYHADENTLYLIRLRD